MLHDAVTSEDSIEIGQWQAARAHEVFADDLEPVDGGRRSEDGFVVRTSQTNTHAEVG